MKKQILDTRTCVGEVFLVLRKAFDTVNNEILLSKLTYFDFSLDIIQWIKSYMELRKQCVRIDNVKSTFMGFPVGVPLGSILGPLLFCLYVKMLRLLSCDVLSKDVNVGDLLLCPFLISLCNFQGTTDVN